MGMGNPLLDISANVDQDLLDKYDVKVDSAILAEEKHQPLYQELVEKYSVQYIAGGATQNSMRIAQWMLQQYNMPNMVAFLGCVGTDAYAKQLEDCATVDGVTVHYMKDETTPTGTCAALIHNNERALVANLAAANNFKPSHLETEQAQEIIQAVDIYYSAGFFLTVSVDALVTVASHMCTHNKIFALNLSAPFIIDFFAEPLATAMEYADYVFGNESEAATYGKKHGIEGSDGEDSTLFLQNVALHICQLPKKNTARPRTVVITQGSKSTLVAVSTATTVTEYAVDPIPADRLVDTNGAGDAFVGGFLAQLVRGQELAECVHAGHYAAGYIIQQSGTTIPGPCEYKK